MHRDDHGPPALALLLGWGIATLWAPEWWALASVRLGLCVLAVLCAIRSIRSGWRPRWHPLLLLLAVATLWGGLQLAAGTTIYRWATEVATLDWFFRLVTFALGFHMLAADVVRRRVLDWLVWFGFVIAVLASLQRFTAPDHVFWLFDVGAGASGMGPFVYHNQYAAFVETVLPLALIACLRGRGWIYAVMAAALAASVVAANSRAGVFVVALETVALVIWWRWRVRRRVPRTALATAALLMIFVAAIGFGPLVEKFQRQDQWGERRDLVYSSIEMALDRPWMGFGLGTWSLAYPAYARFDDGLFDNQAHNDWVQWAAEGGTPFLALMLGMAALLVRPALRTGWGIGLLAVLLHCLVDYHFQQRPVFGYYYFVLAGAASVGALSAQDDAGSAGEDGCSSQNDQLRM